MVNRKKQNGMTGIGWMIVLALVIFGALIILRILPIVMEGYKVKSALKSLKNEPEISRMSNKDILSSLQKRFEIDDVTSVKSENISFDKNAGILTIRIQYENRKSLIANFDIVGKYDEKIEVVQR